ncbi:MAG TPA: ABC transporter permease [Patescibacteria group bacterium]|nr:ABC transporter permease [Patescibacteria group bacterium]
MTVSSRGMARSRSPHPGRFQVGFLSERVRYGLIGFVIVLPLWELVVRLGFIKKVTLSAPSIIANTAINDLIVNRELWPHLFQSSQQFVLGLGLALLTGVPLGLSLGLFRRLNYFLDPWLSAIYATPTIALVPIIVLVLGLGLESKIFIVWLEAIFVITVSTMAGVRAAEARYLDLAKSFRASRSLTFRSVILPSSFPYILTALRLGTTRALVGVVVAEFFASNKGIGFFINFSGTTLRTDRVMLGVIILGLLGVILGEGVRRIERRFEKWRPEFN